MHVRSLLAGAGMAAVVAAVPLAVVSVAHADDGTSSAPTATSCPSAAHQELADYLTAHPDVATELQTLRGLPADQRASARHDYLSAHPDVAADLHRIRADQRSARWERVGDDAADRAAHPAAAGLLDALAAAPAGQRAQTAHQYLTDHPDARTDLQALRQEVHQQRQQCRSGD